MTDSQIRALAAQALAGIAPEADLSTVADDEDLREALDLDSMDFLNFVIALSEGAGLPIPEADAPKLTTMTGLVAYLSTMGPRA
jgi:acyl carrier protein